MPAARALKQDDIFCRLVLLIQYTLRKGVKEGVKEGVKRGVKMDNRYVYKIGSINSVCVSLVLPFVLLRYRRATGSSSSSGCSSLMSECHGTAPSACTVLLIVSPLRGDL